MRTSVAAALAALALAAPSTLAAGGDPIASTGSATSVTATGAVIAGTVNPNGSATTYQVQYGTSGAYGSATAPGSAGSGTTRDDDQRPDRRPRPRHHLPLPRHRDEPERDGRRHRRDVHHRQGAAIAHAARPRLGHRDLGARRRERQPQRRRDERDLPVRAHDRLRVDQRRHLGGRGHLAACACRRRSRALLPGTSYHYRAVATSADGTTYGADTAFATAKAAPAAITGAASIVLTDGARLTGAVAPGRRRDELPVPVRADRGLRPADRADASPDRAPRR